MSVFKEPISWISMSIESILHQTFPNFEFLIINDNPLDTKLRCFLQEIVSKDRRVKILMNEKNIGLTKSLNKGLSASKGKYIARMDADDISDLRRLEKQYLFMEEHTDVIVLGSLIDYFGEASRWKLKDSIKYANEDIKAQLLSGNCMVHPSVMIRKAILDENHIKYDEDYRHSQDYRLWEQLMDLGKFANLKDILLHYRVSNQQITKANSFSQGNYSKIICLRMQQQWLVNNGYTYTVEDLENAPFDILNKIKNDKIIINSKEFRAFVQYVYLCSSEGRKQYFLFFCGDFRFVTFWNIIRYLRNLLN